MNNIERDNYNIVANEIVERFKKRVSGEDVDEYLINENPQDRVMVGMLAANRVERLIDGSYKENSDSKFQSIPAVKVTIIVDKDSNGILRIRPYGSFYYKVRPIFEKYENFLLKEMSKKHGVDFKNLEMLNEHLVEIQEDLLKFPSFYKLLKIENLIDRDFEIDLNYLKKEKFISLEHEIEQRLNACKEEVFNESITSKEGNKRLSEIITKEKFNSFINNDKYIYTIPNWRFDIRLDISEIKDGYRITATYVNLTEEISKCEKDSTYSPNIYNAKLSIAGDGVKFKDIKLDYFLEDYRNDVRVKGISENCSCKYIKGENKIITESIPIYIQKRLITKDKYKEYTSFENLLNNPIESLSFIKDEMISDFERLEYEYEQNNKLYNYNDFIVDSYKNDFTSYKDEIERFSRGIELIKNNKEIKDAFAYMNRAFSTSLYREQKVVEGWRLFQIVFIVSMINDIVHEEYRGNVDLLYFPTGGGKTEAFLGCVVFNLFYDRLRGKNEGVTAFIKYPLRLLSINQLERILITIVKAESVRKQFNVGDNEFSIGYFVGSGNTPNSISESDGNKFLHSDVEILNNDYRLIDTCPNCGKKMVDIVFDKIRWRLVHKCTNTECRLDELPLYMVDNEIYRYLPSVIVSTIDKLAAIGIQPAFKMLFGQVRGKCSVHGYSHNNMCLECYNSHCKGILSEVKELKDPAPTLFIQDELHLIRESLGTFASHYISFIKYYSEYLIKESNRKKIKFIGATATISMYQNQIKNLYHMKGVRFPSAYPSMRKEADFYSEIDKNDVSRIILGYAPYGRSVTNGVWQSTVIFRCVIDDIFSNLEKNLVLFKNRGFNGTKEELKNILNNYWIAIVYNNTKQDSLELFSSFENQGNNMLSDKDIDLFKIDTMTGDDGFQKVRQTLFDIQSIKNKKDGTNLILATSTISHGVDEDSFNQMFFFGMPNNNAEYIQAYSRVGRKYTGIVVDIIRILRERDRSYLKNFNLFHEYKESLIESVPINRWAKNAVYSTLPGILAALLLQKYEWDNNISLAKGRDVKNLIIQNKIDINKVCDEIISIFECNENEKASRVYKEIIKSEVTKILEGFRESSKFDIKTTMQVGDYSKFNKIPMTSLRDTEEQVNINIK